MNNEHDVEKRIVELQAGCKDDLDRAELGSLVFLRQSGIEHLNTVISYEGKDKWQVWAAESIVWTVRRIRGKEWKEVLRGWGQVREYRGYNGGFLPVGISDYAIVLQHILEKALSYTPV